MYVDSHCHLTSAEFAGRMPEIRRDMAAAAVDRALVICTTLEEFPAVHALAMDEPGFWCSVGVHPDTEGLEEPTVDGLAALAARPKVVAIGETGLDYYRLGDRSVADMQWQRDRFARHIEAAERTGLPLVVHTRAASDDTLAILREAGRGRVRGVFHCFTETMDVARAAVELGFHLSFSGILTFRNAADLRAVAAWAPIDRCLIETDSPYLAPVPYRGKTNSPAYVPHVARQLAELKNLSLQHVAEITSRNFEALFTRTAESSQAPAVAPEPNLG